MSASASKPLYGATDFDRWVDDYLRDCSFYGNPNLLTREQLQQCYFHFGFSRYVAYDINSAVVNGFTFMEAVMAARGVIQ